MMNPFTIGMVRAIRHGLFLQYTGRTPRWWEYVFPPRHTDAELEALLIAKQRADASKRTGSPSATEE